jgi:uncharacterized protein (TIGR02466 family)
MKKNKSPNVIGLFPIPLYCTNLFRNLSEKEETFVNNLKKNIRRNIGNIRTTNSYVLEDNNFKKLKNDLLLIVQDFSHKVLNYKNFTPYITQSWINFTEETEHHHQHQHPNSLISGVFYLNADIKNDKIYFYRNRYNQIVPSVKEYNVWNSESWWIPVKTGDVILFPSSLSHMVENKKGTNTRTSLAFNVFAKGIMGEDKTLTELKL